jgi:WD40 repeat protein
MHSRLLPCLLFLCTAAVSAATVGAQTTHQWTENSFSDWESGVPDGVAIASDGTLSAGLPVSLVAGLSATDVWAIASDAQGNAYIATGSPAEVVKITPQGKQTVLFTTKELSVQALRFGPDGSLYAATLPSAKVYRLDVHTSKSLDETTAPVVFDAAQTTEKPKYIWAIQFDKQGSMYLATGNPGAIYRIAASGLLGDKQAKPDLFFVSDEPHIRSLLFAPDGDLLAGSDGTGLVYRIDKAGKGLVIFEADRREITSLALGAQGQIYVASVGAKGRIKTLPPLPVAGAGSAVTAQVTVTVVQPGSTQAVSTNASVPDGSEIDDIPADKNQAPRRLWADANEVVYDLMETPDGLLAATGNHGQVFRIHDDGSYEDVAHADGSQVVGFAPVSGKDDALYLALANTGKLQQMSLSPSPGGTLASAVFDANVPAEWGRAEITAGSPASTYTLEARTGNIDNPERGWTTWKAVDPAAATIDRAAGRFAQWRLTLKPGAKIEALTLNFLQTNVAPVVDEILVAPGTRVNPTAAQPATPQQTSLNFASQGGAAVNLDANNPQTPLSATKDKTGITVRWSAHDDNGDDLRFSVYYRSPNESTWHLLKDNLTDRFYSFDANLLPDGPYRVKVVASDAPSNPDADALTGEKVSELFLVDTGTPRVTDLAAKRDGATLLVTAAATDQKTPIAHAAWSLDAGPWQYVDPVGRLSDALTEQYSFPVPLSAATAAGTHVLTLRVFDRYENEGSAQTSIPASQQ